MKEGRAFWVLTIALAAYLLYGIFVKPGGKLELGPAVSEVPEPVVLHPAPDFSLKNPDGARIVLSSLKGKSVLLVFWAPWCPACLRELPGLERTAESRKEKLEVLAVATRYESAEEVVRTAKAKKLDQVKVLLDKDGAIADGYRIGVFPTSLILDASGIVRYRINGTRSWDGDGALEDLDQVASLK